MAKVILVTKAGGKQFKVTIPDGARITFGPWSPPSGAESKYSGSDKALNGTLRVYEGTKSTENIVAVFSGVESFRDLSLGYAEQVAREEGAVIWKDDEKGYVREDKVNRQTVWVDSDPALLGSGEDDPDNA